MKKFEISYLAGESRYSDKGVDYMLCKGEWDDEDFELYAELDPDGYDGYYDDDGEWITTDEWGTELDLLREILSQADELGIPHGILGYSASLLDVDAVFADLVEEAEKKNAD